jgi:hypothetical protein
MATDAATSNLIELSTGVTSKTGAYARLADANTTHVKRQKMARLMASFLKHKLRHHLVPLTLQPERNPPPNFAVGGQDPCKRFGVRATESWRVSGVARLGTDRC